MGGVVLPLALALKNNNNIQFLRLVGLIIILAMVSFICDEAPIYQLFLNKEEVTDQNYTSLIMGQDKKKFQTIPHEHYYETLETKDWEEKEGKHQETPEV